MSYFDSVIPVLAVKDLDNVRSFYTDLFGEPTVEPADGICEWEIADGAWIQVAEIPERAGQSAVVVGATDVDALVAELRDKAVAVSDVEDYGVVRVAVAVDPEGNELQFAQEVEEIAGAVVDEV